MIGTNTDEVLSVNLRRLSKSAELAARALVWRMTHMFEGQESSCNEEHIQVER